LAYKYLQKFGRISFHINVHMTLQICVKWEKSCLVGLGPGPGVFLRVSPPDLKAVQKGHRGSQLLRHRTNKSGTGLLVCTLVLKVFLGQFIGNALDGFVLIVNSIQYLKL
jgi:hypothetical protein